MKVVSVINYKGGVGKTTLTACLASYLWSKDVNVLLVDMDAQCNLTCQFVPDRLWQQIAQEEKPSLRNWYEGMMHGENPFGNGKSDQRELRSLILGSRQGSHQLGLIPSHLDLLDVDMKLAAYIAASGPDKKRRHIEILGALRGQLRPLAEACGFDLVLLDCPPNFNLVTQTAIIASDNILIPTRPNPVSTMGIDHLIRKRGGLFEKFNEFAATVGGGISPLTTPKILGIVPMMGKIREGSKLIEANAAVEFGLASMLRELSEREKDDVILFKGVRHNEKLFSENSPQSALNSDYAKSGGAGAADDIRRTGRQIAEVLGVLQPNFSWIPRLILELQKKEIEFRVLKKRTRFEDEAGAEIALCLYHLPAEYIDRVEMAIHGALCSRLGEKMAQDVRRSFLFALGGGGIREDSGLNPRVAMRLSKLRSERNQS